ncbi:MAG: hypothetical protein R3B68_06335 [Phycisphaerales bacterium]
MGRLAPKVVGASGLASGVIVGLLALARPAETATAAVGAGSVVLAVGGMYAVLATVRTRHLLSLTTLFMGLSMARLLASVAIGVAYMVTAVGPDGGSPDKFVFAVAFLGVSLVTLAVETPLVRGVIREIGADLSGEGGATGPAARSSSASSSSTSDPSGGDA